MTSEEREEINKIKKDLFELYVLFHKLHFSVSEKMEKLTDTLNGKEVERLNNIVTEIDEKLEEIKKETLCKNCVYSTYVSSTNSTFCIKHMKIVFLDSSCSYFE